MQTDHQILARRPVLEINFKKENLIMDFAVLAGYRVKIKENEKRDKYLDLDTEKKSYGKWRWRSYQL